MGFSSADDGGGGLSSTASFGPSVDSEGFALAVPEVLNTVNLESFVVGIFSYSVAATKNISYTNTCAVLMLMLEGVDTTEI